MCIHSFKDYHSFRKTFHCALCVVEETAAAASSESLQPQQPLVSLRSSSSCCKHLKVAQNNNQVDVDHNPETKVVIEAKVLNKMTSDPDEDDEEVSHGNTFKIYTHWGRFASQGFF